MTNADNASNIMNGTKPWVLDNKKLKDYNFNWLHLESSVVNNE